MVLDLARTLRQRLLAAGAVLSCLLPGVPLLVLDPAAARLYALLASTVLALVAAVACLYACLRGAGRVRGACALLSVACLGWGLGNAYWCWNELVAHSDVLFPSPGDYGFLVFPVAGTAAVWLLSGRSSTGSRLTALLDGLIVTGSLLSISWVLILRSVAEAGGDTKFAFSIALAYPLGDIVLMTMVFLLATRATRGSGLTIALIATGLIGMTVSDTVFAVDSGDGGYVSGQHSDAGWVVGFAALALAGLAISRNALQVTRQLSVRGWQLGLPYVPFTAAVVVSAVQAHAGRQPDTLQLVVLLIVFIMVMSRQLVTLVHNSSLTDRLRHQAFHDPLTGLANRALFTNRLDHAVALHERDGRPLAVMYVDLDDFKRVNDTSGHHAGDDLLRGIADRLRSCARPGDTIARLGGDEFAILLEHGERPDLLAERILQALVLPFTIASRSVTAKASIGIAVMEPASGSTPTSEVLLQHVDLALYAAKGRGKATYALFDPLMTQDVDAEARLREELLDALVTDQLRVVMHPVIGLADGELVGLEALGRWDHPVDGEVLPEVFVVAAARVGLAAEVGAVLLDAACRQFTRWTCDDDTYLGVNVSAAELVSPDFSRTLLATAARHGVRPDRIVLDVAEQVIDEGLDAVMGALVSLREWGVRISVDDFGTGRCSIRSLQRLPIDILKIDDRLVADVLTDPATHRLVTTVVATARSLDLLVVAEGLERQDQADRLRELGCSHGQGLLFGVPTDVDRLEARCERHTATEDLEQAVGGSAA